MTGAETRPLRIGVNALYLIPGGVGGTEIYLRSLLRALSEIDRSNRYFVFTNRETGADLVPGGENWIAAPLDVRAANRPARILCEQTTLPFEAHRLRLDVLFNPGFTAPVFGSCPNVTVFHDLQHKRQPENFRWFDLPFWRILLYAAARRSKHLLADSEATRDDLIRYYALAPEKITVAPLGVDPVFFEIARRRRPERYFLAVSTLHPHKNLDRLIRAFAEFHTVQPDFRLIIAGLRGFHTETARIAARAVGARGLRPIYGLGSARRTLRSVRRRLRVFLSFHVRGVWTAGARSAGGRCSHRVLEYSARFRYRGRRRFAVRPIRYGRYSRRDEAPGVRRTAAGAVVGGGSGAGGQVFVARNRADHAAGDPRGCASDRPVPDAVL